ncbi:MAG: hypothetical protein J6X55_03795, partial [Victivallales bacterium]|nr:hypothetical protein [Victivallales bacterium]
MKTTLIITPGFRQGYVTVPLSKSHLHRLLIADFLAGGKRYAEDIGTQSFSEDVNATRRCLAALANCNMPTLDCGESGSTLRFMLPVAMTQT